MIASGSELLGKDISGPMIIATFSYG
jgi:hypothetical protein